MIASAEVTAGARKVHDFLTVGAPAPLQEAAVTALGFSSDYHEELQKAYTRRRDLFLSYLEKANLKFTRLQGAYYVLVDIAEFEFDGDTAFCAWPAKKIGVAAVPGSSFFREPVSQLIRFHFARSESTLSAAGERLLRLADKSLCGEVSHDRARGRKPRSRYRRPRKC